MIKVNHLEDPTKHPLWDQQVELEAEMRDLGIDRFRKANLDAKESGKETRNPAVRRLVSDSMQKMLAGLKEFRTECESGKAGPKHSAYRYLKLIDDDMMAAYSTVRVILDSVTQRRSLTYTAILIAQSIEDELNYRVFRKDDIAGFLKAGFRAKQTTNESFKRRSVLGTAKKLGVDLLDWPRRDKILVGSKLIEIFIESTGLCEKILLNQGRESDQYILGATPEIIQWIDEECRRREWLSPSWLPCLMPPRPWTSPFEGGYWTKRIRRLTLVKTASKAYLEELANVEMPQVYQAVNALQNTPWAVNERVRAVMENLWLDRSELGNIPMADDEPLPVKPVWLVEGVTKETMTEAQMTEFKQWKTECVEARQRNAKRQSQRLSFVGMLRIANRYAGKEFHYVYQMDWRGRYYPVGLYLQPQGDDMQRGLLEFANAVPINDQDGADWLAIHGAGLWGVDKVAFADRVQWIKDNEKAILASAENPFDNRFWADAEKPWQALAFCFDWAGFVSHGFGYESSLPVQMDGTCNGLQNFSAMLLDEVGGKAVNLMPSKKPEDIYLRVCDIVVKMVENDAAAGNELAMLWVGNVNRKAVKRPVMTLAYGARRYGFTDMIFEDTIKPWKKKSPETFPFGKQGFEAAQYLGGLIWEAAGQVVVSAFKAMEWLQEVARTVSKEGLPINWTVPSGFLVQQKYQLRDMKVIDFAFQKVRIQISYDKGSEKLDNRKQASGIAPNFVHALDAAHMTRTVCASNDLGVRSFSFIHDSYGTHAGNCAALATILREEFVRMYSERCALGSLKADLEGMLGHELPALPEKGSLDLTQVLDSDFFFA